MAEYRLILSPVDFSQTSQRAFETALDLAARLNAEVRVMHVYQLPASALPEGVLQTPHDLEATVEEELRKRLDEFVEQSTPKGVTVSTGLCEGVPYVEITRAAQELGADMIVIGTHGRTGLAHLMLGSVAERVLRTSEIPVLTVRQHQDAP
jgi:nucleotide-binding universal stress UspA family protein